MHTFNLILDGLLIGSKATIAVCCVVKLLDLAFPARVSR
jgi:hypothetical protein